MTGVLKKNRRRQGCACTEKRPWGCRKKTAICKPRLQEKITLSSPWSWTFSLQNCKKIHFWCSVHLSVVFCYGSLISTHLFYAKYVFHACMLSCFSRVLLFVTLWTVAHQAPLSRGFSRQEHWSGLPCPSPEDLPDPGIEPVSPVAPALQADSLLLEPPETIYVYIYKYTHIHTKLLKLNDKKKNPFKNGPNILIENSPKKM